ncbi:hypothetical protein BaRGS_00025907 [Batillaria attramentaria]|uniref:Uncharacterized protein n=1 Tax=Batillaria attramentaria TaxID=370345 RepID=A0ABD0K6D5_9CAEN
MRMILRNAEILTEAQNQLRAYTTSQFQSCFFLLCNEVQVRRLQKRLLESHRRRKSSDQRFEDGLSIRYLSHPLLCVWHKVKFTDARQEQRSPTQCLLKTKRDS